MKKTYDDDDIKEKIDENEKKLCGLIHFMFYKSVLKNIGEN